MNFLENFTNSLVNSENFPENFPAKAMFRACGSFWLPDGWGTLLDGSRSFSGLSGRLFVPLGIEFDQLLQAKGLHIDIIDDVETQVKQLLVGAVFRL